MDESVVRAMAKWPNVPRVHGWLGLDRRGHWRLRGERISHPGTVSFIGRNYACDTGGNWYFQNGPQTVFVELEYTPWVLFSDVQGGLQTHTGLVVASLREVWLDDEGSLLVSTEHGAGLVCDRDLGDLLASFRGTGGREVSESELVAALQDPQGEGPNGLAFAWRSQILPVNSIRKADVPRRLSFVQVPADSGDAS